MSEKKPKAKKKHNIAKYLITFHGAALLYDTGHLAANEHAHAQLLNVRTRNSGNNRNKSNNSVTVNIARTHINSKLCQTCAHRRKIHTNITQAMPVK